MAENVSLWLYTGEKEATTGIKHVRRARGTRQHVPIHDLLVENVFMFERQFEFMLHCPSDRGELSILEERTHGVWSFPSGWRSRGSG